MKKIILLLTLGVLLCGKSCTIDHIMTSNLIYINYSDHKIEIKGFYQTNLKMDIVLQKGEKATFQEKSDPNILLYKDSIMVIYDDTIAIQHGIVHSEYGFVKKDLTFGLSYDITPTGENERRCEYTFTNEDYEEALLLHQSEE